MSKESVLEGRAARFFYAVTAYPRTIIAVSLMLMIAPVVFLPQMTSDTSREAFIPKDSPALMDRDRLKEEFGLGDPLVIGIFNEGPQGVFTPDSLHLVSWFSERLAEVPGIDPERITSIATQNNIVGTEDALVVEPFLESDWLTNEQALEVREAVMGFQLYVGNLVAEEGDATLIVAELRKDADAEQVYQRLLALRETAPINDETVFIAGQAPVSSLLAKYIRADLTRLIPLTVLIVTVLLILAFRTPRGVLIPSLVLVGASFWAMGMMAASGTPFFVVTNGLIPILMAISVADGIHILSQYYEELAASPDASPRELAVRSMVQMWRPVLVTSLTDIAGMMAIFFASYMPPMKAFGLFASVGIAIALLVSFFCIPAFLTILKPKQSAAFKPSGPSFGPYSFDWFSRALARIGRMVVKHPRRVSIVALMVLTVGLVGAVRLEVDEEPIRNLNSGDELFTADRALNAAFDGTNFLDILVEAEQPQGLLEPEALHRIEALQVHLESLPHVNGTVSIVDYLKQMNLAMNEDRQDEYRIPESSALAAQYLLLYSNSGGPEDFEEVIDYDYKAGTIRVAIDTGLYSERKPIVEEADRYVAENFTDEVGLKAMVSGSVDIDYHWISGIERSHFQSVFFALLAVWLVTAISYKSVIGGVFAVLPVSIWVLLVYAVMGFTEIWLGVATSMFAAIAIGTGVDFAIHSLDRLISLIRDEKRTVEEALARFYPSTGRALLFNFAILFLSFLVLLGSANPGLMKFGGLVGVAALTSFLASIIVLPALLLIFRPAFLIGRDSGKTYVKTPVPPAVAPLVFALVVAGGVAAAMITGPVQAQTSLIDSYPTGDEIARYINARDTGVQVTRKLTMRLTNRRGKTRTRQTIVYRKYYSLEKRSITFYESPASIRGTALLSFNYGDEREDDQWLYLPAARKIRRISSSDRGDYFLGTDFTFEDIDSEGKVELADYTRRTVGEEDVDGHHCYILESVPVSKKIANELGYGRVRSWVDSNIWVTRKVKYWDVQGVPLKTLHVTDIRQIDGIWSTHHMLMENLKTGHASAFEFNDIDYASEIGSELFTQRTLRQGR